MTNIGDLIRKLKTELGVSKLEWKTESNGLQSLESSDKKYLFSQGFIFVNDGERITCYDCGSSVRTQLKFNIKEEVSEAVFSRNKLRLDLENKKGKLEAEYWCQTCKPRKKPSLSYLGF